MRNPPKVITSTLPDLLNSLQSTESSKNSKTTTLLICLPRATFIKQLLLQPPPEATLSHLSSPLINIRFLESVQHLLAFLSTSQERGGTVYLLYPISLHRYTTQFSAQGFSRTFAAAVDACLRWDAELIVCEPDEDRDGGAWKEVVPLLGVGTTGKFKNGEKGWAGRSISIERVVGRWCTFENHGENKET